MMRKMALLHLWKTLGLTGILRTDRTIAVEVLLSVQQMRLGQALP